MAKRKQISGFTIIEVIVIVVVLLMIAVLLIPALAQKRELALRVECTRNMKRLVLGYALWQQDSEKHKLPFWTPYEDLGLKDPGTNHLQISGIGEFAPTLRSNAWLQFLFIHNEVENPKVLRCPADRDRKTATSWKEKESGLVAPSMRNNAISYCIGIDQQGFRDIDGLVTDVFLTERHMEYDAVNASCSANVSLTMAVRVVPGSTTPTRVGWKVQNPKLHKNGGNVALADGSAHMVTAAQLRELLDNHKDDNGELHFIYP